MRYKQSTVLLLILIVIHEAIGQPKQKDVYNSELDSLWSLMTYLYKSTNDGQWFLMKETFGSKELEIILKNTKDTLTYRFPKSEWIMFSDNSKWFGCITSTKELILMDLETRSENRYSNIRSYRFSKSGNYLVGIQKSEEKKESLLIVNLRSKETKTIANIEKFSWHPHDDQLLIHGQKNSKKTISQFDLKTAQQRILKETEVNNFKHMVWSDSGNAFIFSEHSKSDNRLNYKNSKGLMKTLDNKLLEMKYSGFKISSQPVYISGNGNKILFHAQLKTKLQYDENETMQVWNANDHWEFPKLRDYEYRENQFRLMAWYPADNKIIAIETKETPTAALSVDHDYAIVYNQLIYEPLYKEFPNSDIYVTNILTGEKNLVIKNQYLAPGRVTISPEGKYIAYFNNSHWWVYDIVKKQNKNLTKNLKVSFANTNYDRPKDIPPFGQPGWTENDENIILYDQYDIWSLTPDGKHNKRMTKGKEEGIKYRINRDYRDYLTINIYFSSTKFDLSKGVFLDISEVEVHKTGLALWNNEHGIQKLIFEESKVDNPLTSENLSNIIFRKQKFNQPTSVHNIDLINNSQNLIYQSNTALTNMDLGNSKLVNYDCENKQLKGSLLYPANFDASKKYPMIVFIYEKASYLVNIFSPPSPYSYIGFNALNYTMNDYFVFYPDISYTIGDPALSALNCVTSAVNEVIEFEYVDENKIGLLGHSFGGYESAFIATQTDLFAAIVAGASVTNTTSHYHGMGWNGNRPEIWRYESQQWRMGDSYHNIKDAYLRNSPMHHVEKVVTPLLLWTGKEDYQVHWMQSIEMFLALKRMKKTSKLLLFENEGHAIKNNKNQMKLSNEIINWFDKYCK